MAQRKNGVHYLVIVLFLSAILCSFCSPLIADCISVLRSGVGTTRYLHVSEQTDGRILAAAAENGELIVVEGNRQGKRTGRQKLSCDHLPENWQMDNLYAANGKLYLSLYELSEQGSARSLRLYELDSQTGEAQLLINQDCQGDYRSEQVSSVALSAISVVDETLSFAVVENNQATIYRTAEEGGLIEQKKVPCEQNSAVCVLTDGCVVAAGAESIMIDGTAYPRPGQAFYAVCQSGAGLYALDAVTLELQYTELTSPERFQTVLRSEKKAYDLNGLCSVAITDDGGLLLLLENGRLVLDKESAVTDLSEILYGSASRSGLILAGLAAGVLLAAFILWLIFCVWDGLHLSFALRWGIAILVVAVLGTNAVLQYQVQPQVEQTSALRCYELAAAVAELAGKGASLARRIADTLVAVENTLTADLSVAVYQKDNQQYWRIQENTSNIAAGIRGELTNDFDRPLALQAEMDGTARAAVVRKGETRYLYYRTLGNKLIAVNMGADGLQTVNASAVHGVSVALWWVTGGLSALVVLACISIILQLRKLSDGMQKLCAGESNVQIPIQTGDELEELAGGIHLLSNTLQDLENESGALVDSYRRFVPENLLSLLEKEHLADVDKHTVATRRMATMMVWFGFPQSVYEADGKQLFDHVNEVIERTVPIITGRGGTVFNLAYNGYDAVFDGALRDAISTAVAMQQEILAINQEHELDGRPCVTMHIALDVGEILMGVVGDSTQLEPVAISSSFAVTKRLLELCRVLEAGILCTETVFASAGNYGSRYMGKCKVGGNDVRTYEIYEGDPFAVRRVKTQTTKRFSEGVYLLYSRDFSGAKKVFLDLVHCDTRDGGVRYYLYLAHELEKNQEREISLDDRI